MKKDIHPQYYPKAKISCNCGMVFEIGSTVEAIKVEVCSACHPFYTGKQNLIDTAGRVERFTARLEKSRALKSRSSKSAPKVKDDHDAKQNKV